MSRPDIDQSIRVIDSHTGGEPTRVVVQGAPDLGDGDMASRRQLLAQRYDWLRTALIDEPRGSGWIVGALLTQPVRESASVGVVFFNNVGYLGMCGHGLIGVVATLAHLARIKPGEHRIETPVGEVGTSLAVGGEVTIENVCSRRTKEAVCIPAPPYGEIVGDVAWGGNWFFVAESPLPIAMENVRALTDVCRSILAGLNDRNICGDDGAVIDHVELFGPPPDASLADARNFVLCPGGHYDRSPCGTGASAKIACLAADGKLQAGEMWRQESIIGSRFDVSYRLSADSPGVIPQITGSAFVTADSRMVLARRDPYRFGISQGAALHG